MSVGGKFLRRGIVFLGPPGCGKGTQARILTQNGTAHLSSGAILSTDARTKNIVAARQLVPDKLYFSVMADHVRKAIEHAQPVVLDGVVRTPQQVGWLTDLLSQSDYRLGVLDFAVQDYGLLIPRLLERASAEARIDDAGLPGCHQRIGEYMVNIAALRRELNSFGIPSQLINAELSKERVAEEILLALRVLFQ